MYVLRWVDGDDRLAVRAGMFAYRFMQPHPEIEVADYIAAAPTRSPNAELWALDVRHFPMFPGLNPPY